MSETSPLTFTQGFMLGQISFLAIILLFMRYVVFSPADKGDEQGWKRRREEREKKALAASKAPPTPAPGAAHVLAKAAYEMASHGAESTDWINVLFAQVMQGYRNDMLAGGGEEGAKLRVEKWLNPEGGRTSWLDPIEVTSMSLGTAYPLFSNARIRPADAQGRIRAEIDVDFNDAISLALSTSVLINFPRPRFAVLPVSLGVELVSIGGTLSVQIHDPEEGRQHLHACLLPDFHLNLKTTTLLGSRAKLQDVPKLEQLILSRIRSAIQDRIVHPKHFSLSLPQLLSPRPAPSPSSVAVPNGGAAPLVNGTGLRKDTDIARSTVTTAPPTGVSSPTQAQFSAQQMIDDLGEDAVVVMSQAVKEGFGRMVHDLGLDALAGGGGAGGAGGAGENGTAGSIFGSGANSGSGSRGMPNGSGVGAVYGASQAQAQAAQMQAQTQTQGTRGRRIHMPAGFPYSRASSTVEPTPLPTPGLAIPGGLSYTGGSSSASTGAGAGSGAGVSRMLSSVHPPSAAPSQRSSTSIPPVNGTTRDRDGEPSMASTSSYKAAPAGSTEAGMGSGDRFRFRGQFAGPAGTGMGGGHGEEPRRVGVLNSRQT